MNAALVDAQPTSLEQRIAGAPWRAIGDALDADGVATLPRLLTQSEADGLAGVYAERERFRSRVVMERHRFGAGEYQYFAYPLPSIVQALREIFYAGLVPHANRWVERLGDRVPFPSTLEASSKAATRPVSDARRRCCCATRRAATTVSTRISTARRCSRFRS